VIHIPQQLYECPILHFQTGGRPNLALFLRLFCIIVSDEWLLANILAGKGVLKWLLNVKRRRSQLICHINTLRALKRINCMLCGLFQRSCDRLCSTWRRVQASTVQLCVVPRQTAVCLCLAHCLPTLFTAAYQLLRCHRLPSVSCHH